MADSGKLMKMEVDYSDTVDRRLPEYQEMAKVSERENCHFVEKVSLTFFLREAKWRMLCLDC